jgi:hypothetical protein
MDLLPAYKPAAVLEEFQKRRITTFAGGPAALLWGFAAAKISPKPISQAFASVSPGALPARSN